MCDIEESDGTSGRPTTPPSVGDGDGEGKWDALPFEILTKVAEFLCKVPTYPLLREDDIKTLRRRRENFKGAMRLVSRSWCLALDSTITVLRPTCQNMSEQEMTNTLITKFKHVEKIDLHDCEQNTLARRPLGSLYVHLPIKELALLKTEMRLTKEERECLTTLTKLDVLDVPSWKDVTWDGGFEHISSMTSLRELSFPGRDIVTNDLVSIGRFTNMTRLAFGDLEEDLTPLSQLTSLEHLEIGYYLGVIITLSSISNLTRLTFLDVKGGFDCCMFEDFSVITALTSLKSLVCSLHMPALEYIAALDLTSLRVELEEFKDESGIEGKNHHWKSLSCLTLLKVLSIHGSVIPRAMWPHLVDVPNMRSLELEGGFDTLNAGVLGCLTNLRSLSVGLVHKIDMLAPLVNLKSLKVFFWGNERTDMVALQNLVGVEHLVIEMNGARVQDFQYAPRKLVGFTNLRSLRLQRLYSFSQVEYDNFVDACLKACECLFDGRLTCLGLSIQIIGARNAKERYTPYAKQVLQEYPNLDIIL